MKFAKHYANIFSDDPTTKVGCIFYDTELQQIISIGCNRFPISMGINAKSSQANAAKLQRPEKYDWIEHAERNAVFNALRVGVSLKNTVCLTTLAPCINCARAIIEAGARTLVTLTACGQPVGEFNKARKLLEKAKVVVVELSTEMGLNAPEVAMLSPFGWDGVPAANATVQQSKCERKQKCAHKTKQ